jgi:ribosomal protein S18 acetylase RimI-like enzyme
MALVGVAAGTPKITTMEGELLIAARRMTHPDAAGLVREMTVEIAVLYDDDPDWSSRLGAEVFAPPGGQFVVGYLDGRPVACAAYRRIDDELAQAQRVFVRPEARSVGIASRMMDHIEALATEAGYRTMRLETGVLQPAAITMYERLGYRQIPAFAPYEDDPLSRCYAKRIG